VSGASKTFVTLVVVALGACGGTSGADGGASELLPGGGNSLPVGVPLTADKALQFHWVLGGALDVNEPMQMGLRDFYGNTLPEPDVYDIDGELNDKSVVDYLHAKGKKVICYFDAGVYETYRTDAWKFEQLQPQIWKNKDDGWDNSYWLDYGRVSELEPIMRARTQMCKDKGFDSIEPDEIDGWQNDTGFYGVHTVEGYDKQLVYDKALATWAHEAGMSMGLKGNIEQAHDLYDDFDWTLNEECFMNDECLAVYDEAHGEDVTGLAPFVQRNKAVFIAEYPAEFAASKRDSGGKALKASVWNPICTTSQKNHFNTVQFVLGLPVDGGRLPCRLGW
jgi:hypothetical protein